MVATVSTCCCCFSLKTGTIVIGVLGILGSILSIIEDLVVVSIPTAATTGDEKEIEIELDPETKEIFRKVDLAVSIITLLSCLAELIFSIILVYGACKEKPNFVKPWIYYSIVCIAIVDITLTILIVCTFVFIGALAGFMVLISAFVASLIAVYVIIVVNSYHRQLMGMDLPVMAAKV